MQRNMWRINVDAGGTFTDCLAVDPSGKKITLKVLSSGKLRLNAFLEQNNLIRILSSVSLPNHFFKDFSGDVDGNRFSVLDSESDQESHSQLLKVEFEDNPPDLPDSFSVDLFTGEPAPVLAARLATGTSLRNTFPPLEFRLAGTKTTNALLEGKYAKAAMYVTEGFRDLMVIGTQQRNDIFSLKVEKDPLLYDTVFQVNERMSSDGEILQELDSDSVMEAAKKSVDSGIKTAAVSLLHAWKYPEQEQKLREVLISAGFETVIISSETAATEHYLNRTQTTLVNAILTPVLQNWISEIKKPLGDQSVFALTSAGGLTSLNAYRPVDSLLSGPAGGVVGALASGKDAGFEKIISFDMGGTSTDVARCDGEIPFVTRHNVGHASVLANAAAVETVAAGGGSICSFDGLKLSVGPESAGADPGPACYGKGGPLTITDINLLAGRIRPEQFTIPVFPEASRKKFDELFEQVRKTETSTEPAVLMESLLNIANEKMAEAVRSVSVRKGFRPDNHTLVAFGGAGGQHACQLAGALGIRTVLFPADASVLSAAGLHRARHESVFSKTIIKPLEESLPILEKELPELEKTAVEDLIKKSGIQKNRVSVKKIAVIRPAGKEASVQTEIADHHKKLQQNFENAWKERYGYDPEHKQAELFSVQVIARSMADEDHQTKKEFSDPGNQTTADVMVRGSFKTCSVRSSSSISGDLVKGPAVVTDHSTTIFLDEGWEIRRTESGILQADQKSDQAGISDLPLAAKIELFGNRLQGIADEMGEMLRRTSVSVNVKERLDFSCAILNHEGTLIANAAHIPVHLGALGICTRTVMKSVQVKPGDVIITNHPAFGGSHLPDVTVLTPVFQDDQLLAWTVSRAHHAEIGGKRPGSMPPDAKTLDEEGCVLIPEHLVDGGVYRKEAILERFTNGRYPSRNPQENMADIEAAVAANKLGAERLLEWNKNQNIGEAFDSILTYTAERLNRVLSEKHDGHFTAIEYLDDDTPLRATIHIRSGRALFDFTGSGETHPGNLNATPAIVHSVVLYVLRLLLKEPVPLNEGLMSSVEINLPEGILNPNFDRDPAKCPAVVGGNTETSQRLTDTLIKALGMAGCSQGTMNNVLFGNDTFGYYETICGGTGAGPDFDGCSAVHHHMTNTRITDTEILERRYPVRVRKFSVRETSGGKGNYSGGDGVVRELEFTEPVEVSLLSQHRKYPPFGMKGGQNGSGGLQRIIRKNGDTELLSGICEINAKPGDRLIIETPGGGGFGEPV